MEENKEQETVVMKGSNNKGLITALILIILLLAGGLIYMVFFYKENKEPVNNNIEEKEQKTNNETNKEETKEENTEVKEEKKYNLTVYYYDAYDTLCIEYDNETCKRKAFTIEADTKDAKLLAVDRNTSKSFILYSDNGIKLYDVKKKTVKNLNLKDDYKDYEINTSEDESKVIGISFVENNYIGYYNVALGKKLYDKKYKIKGTADVYQVNDKYISIQNEDYSYLLSCDKEEVKLTHKNGESVYGYSSIGSNGKYFYILSLWYTDAADVIEVYSNSFKLIIKKNNNDIFLENMYYINNYFYILENSTIKKYDESGNVVSTSKAYSNIHLFAREYIVYVNENDLIIENYLNNTEKKVLAKWQENSYIDGYASGYYSRKSLDDLVEKDKKEGFYIVVYYGSDSNGNSIKDANGNYGIEYCYTTDKKIVEYPIKQEMGGRAKPVLYLYPTKETNVTVKFSNPNVLTTTYPKYINSWNVTVKPNGDMIDKDGKYYYALYWDEKRYHEVDFSEGFYVEGKDVISFLEEKLKYIGLNDKERNEFIMYWLPIMETNKKNLVYFELTKERELGNKLIISPKPDSLLRVSIHIKKVNSKTTIKEQKLETFKRVGFTAVEWGGMTY